MQRLALPISAAAALLLAGCAETQLAIYTVKSMSGKDATTGDRPLADARAHERMSGPEQVKIGKPYEVKGVWYYPKVTSKYDETGVASWYGKPFHGRKTANGETYDMNALSAAHKTLPMPSFVRVTNLENGRTVILRVNDRGPFVNGRVIDVSRRAAQLLGFYKNGIARVRVSLESKEGEGAPAPQAKVAESRKTLPAVPQGSVKAEALPPPEGIRAAPALSETPVKTASAPIRIADAGPRPALPAAKIVADSPAEAGIKTVAVAPTRLFLQAGAFLKYDNANRLRARLAAYGPSKVSTVQIDSQEFFRVRLGPLRRVADADRLLNRMIADGYKDAHIIVD